MATEKGKRFIDSVLNNTDADLLESNEAITGLCLAMASTNEAGAREWIFDEEEVSTIVMLLDSIREDIQAEMYERFVVSKRQSV